MQRVWRGRLRHGSGGWRLGLDGYAYVASLLGTSISYGGSVFSIGASGTPNAVANKTVNVTPGAYAKLNMLGTSIYEAGAAGQPIVVNYSDGTTATFTQKMSDWGAPKNYAGETTLETITARINPRGAAIPGAWSLYGYSFALDSAKTVESVTLPATRDVIVFGIGFIPASTSTPAPAANAGYTALALDSTFTSTNKIDLKDTRAAGFDWYTTMPTWSADVSPASKFTIVDNAGTSALRIDGTGDGYSLYGALKVKAGVGTCVSATAEQSAYCFVGHQFTGGAYYEARLAMELPVVVPGAARTNGAAAAWPAFWAVNSLSTGMNRQWPGAPTSYVNGIEMDVMEFMPKAVTGAATAVATFTAHDWYGEYDVTCPGYCQTMAPGTTKPDPFSLWTRESSTLKLQTEPTDALPTFHNYGLLIVPSVRNATTGVYSDGYLEYFLDDASQGAKYFVGELPDTSATSNGFTPTPTALWTYAGAPSYPYALILSAGGNAFMEVQYVRVWQK